MKCEHVEEMHALLPAVHAAGVLGIDWLTLFKWLAQYGVPLVLQVLTLVLPLLQGKSTLTLAQAVKYIGDALAAVSQGKDLPPLPAVAK